MNNLQFSWLAALSGALLGGCGSLIVGAPPSAGDNNGFASNALIHADREADVPPPHVLGPAPAAAPACWLACAR